MKATSLIASLLIAASVSAASFTVQAEDSPQKTVEPSNINTRDLKVGDRAPDILVRKESAIGDWKQRGLKQPAEESQWARVNDRYVLVKITNGTILDIAPAK